MQSSVYYCVKLSEVMEPCCWSSFLIMYWPVALEWDWVCQRYEYDDSYMNE